jgi:hypothetical protein
MLENPNYKSREKEKKKKNIYIFGRIHYCSSWMLKNGRRGRKVENLYTTPYCGFLRHEQERKRSCN